MTEFSDDHDPQFFPRGNRPPADQGNAALLAWMEFLLSPRVEGAAFALVLNFFQAAVEQQCVDNSVNNDNNENYDDENVNNVDNNDSNGNSDNADNLNNDNIDDNVDDNHSVQKMQRMLVLVLGLRFTRCRRR